jgi:hypothetical protein
LALKFLAAIGKKKKEHDKWHGSHYRKEEACQFLNGEI